MLVCGREPGSYIAALGQIPGPNPDQRRPGWVIPSKKGQFWNSAEGSQCNQLTCEERSLHWASPGSCTVTDLTPARITFLAISTPSPFIPDTNTEVLANLRMASWPSTYLQGEHRAGMLGRTVHAVNRSPSHGTAALGSCLCHSTQTLDCLTPPCHSPRDHHPPPALACAPQTLTLPPALNTVLKSPHSSSCQGLVP